MSAWIEWHKHDIKVALEHVWPCYLIHEVSVELKSFNWQSMEWENKNKLLVKTLISLAFCIFFFPTYSIMCDKSDFFIERTNWSFGVNSGLITISHTLEMCAYSHSVRKFLDWFFLFTLKWNYAKKKKNQKASKDKSNNILFDSYYFINK